MAFNNSPASISSIHSSVGVWLSKKSWICILMFIVGATRTLDFQLIGRVSLAEVIAFSFVPFFWMSSVESSVNRNLCIAIALLGTLFLGIITSDLLNSNSLWYSARAFARPIFMLGFVLFFVQVLRRDPLSVVYLVYGGVVSGLVKYLRPSSFEIESAQQVLGYAGIAFRVTPFVLSVAVAGAVFFYPRSRLLSAGVIICAFLVASILGSPRSILLVLFCITFLILAIKFLKATNRGKRIVLSAGKKFLLVSVLIGSLGFIYGAYTYTAPRGMLGEEARIKYSNQAFQRFGATPWGLVLSGRAPVYGAILGIMERPILGFGSWRHDLTSDFVIEAINNVGLDSRVINNIRQGAFTGGAGHSVLFQAWVENGLVPAIVYICIFCISLKVLLFCIRFDNRMTPFIIFSFVSFSWGFFFSPPDLAMRFWVGFCLAFYVVFMDKQRPLARIEVLP